MEYYYKTQWSHQQEFLDLFLKNHYPLLQKDRHDWRLGVEEEDSSYAIAAILALGAISLFVFPVIGQGLSSLKKSPNDATMLSDAHAALPLMVASARLRSTQSAFSNERRWLAEERPRSLQLLS